MTELSPVSSSEISSSSSSTDPGFSSQDSLTKEESSCPCDEIVGQHLYVGHCIGEGAHGTMNLIRTSGTKPYLVAKYSTLRSNGARNLIEPSIMRSHNHPHINHAHRVLRNKDSLLIIQDHAICDLQQYHLSHETDLKDSLGWCRQLAEAVQYLHTNNIIHCDIKAANVLLYQDSIVKLTDFSISVKKWASDDTFTNGACTSTHRPPECILGEPWNEKIDVWALGCTFYEMVMGHGLFISGSKEELLSDIEIWYRVREENSEKEGKLNETSRLQLNSYYRSRDLAGFRDLLRHMIAPVTERWTIQQVCRHYWLNIKEYSNNSQIFTEGLKEENYKLLQELCDKHNIPFIQDVLPLTHRLSSRSSVARNKKRLLGSYWITLKLHRLHKNIQLSEDTEKLLSNLEHLVASSLGYKLEV